MSKKRSFDKVYEMFTVGIVLIRSLGKEEANHIFCKV